MKERFKSIVLAALFFTALFVSASGVYAASDTNKEADAMFDKKMQSIRDSSQFGIRYKYVDITGDGIHEAIVEYKPKTQGGSGWTCDVYGYEKGSVRRLMTVGEYGLSKCIYYRKTGALILYGSGHGGEWYRYFKLKSNGKYSFSAQKARQAVAGGGASNGSWQYYKGGNYKKISASKFKSLTGKLMKGKRKSFSKWNTFG